MYIAHEEDYKGFHIKIVNDEDAQNPYDDYDMFGKLYHWHKRGFIGEDYSRKQDELQQLINDTVEKGGIAVPVYLYEHSGQTINTTGFSCPWDSGQVGVWLATKAEITKEFDGDKEKARKCIVSQVDTLDDYLRGNVYGFIVKTEHGDDVESCWGFIGDYDDTFGCLPEAKSIVDYYAEKYGNSFVGADI